MAKKGNYKTGPRPNARGLRPHLWKSGPDKEAHKKHIVWRQQKNQAQFREEGWDIPFDVWCEIWGELWYNRGRESGDYCMTRIDWDKPWTEDNVQLITRKEHAQMQGQAVRDGYRSVYRQKYLKRNPSAKSKKPRS